MGKHTAGPWKVSSSILVCSEDGKVIANCLPMVEIAELSIGIEESSSNAALISASPTMYEFILRLARNGNKEAQSTLDALNLGN